MRLSITPHAGTSGAQLRALSAGMLCVAVLSAIAPSSARGEPTPAAAGGDAHLANDPQQVAMARALFEEGLRHVDAEQWALAADRFARVLSLRYSPVAAYNLALARARLGSSVLALEGLRELLANPGLEPTVRDAALSLQKEQQARVGWLTVRVSGECSDCSVELDAKPLPRAALGVAVPVDPGSHGLVLMRDGARIASTNLNVAPGARVDGKLVAPVQVVSARSAPLAQQPQRSVEPEPEPFTPTAPPAALAGSADPKEPKGSLLSSPWFWGGVGVLAAGVVTLGVVLSAGGTEAATPVPGNFSPSVISGQVRP